MPSVNEHPSRSTTQVRYPDRHLLPGGDQRHYKPRNLNLLGKANLGGSQLEKVLTGENQLQQALVDICPMDRVLVVDDQIYFCQLARQVLGKSDQFAVVGETYDAYGAMELIDRLKPDVILMDVEMDGMNGLEATTMIRNRFPGARIVLMSVYDEKEYRHLALRVGAEAFISKKDLSALALARALSEDPNYPSPA